MSTLAEQLRQNATPDAIAADLDRLDHAGRLAAIATLASADFERLYKTVDGRHVELDYYVPAQVKDGEPVRHVGLNSMPVFRTVDKRFVRTATGDLHGYNHLENPLSSAVSGPGYFVVQPRGTPAPDATGKTQLYVNYWQVPKAPPRADWPPVRDNEGLPGKLVYGKMCDYMWRVSDHVSIGEAWRNGRSLRTWFIVCRDTP